MVQKDVFALSRICTEEPFEKGLCSANRPREDFYMSNETSTLFYFGMTLSIQRTITRVTS